MDITEHQFRNIVEKVNGHYEVVSFSESYDHSVPIELYGDMLYLFPALDGSIIYAYWFSQHGEWSVSYF